MTRVDGSLSETWDIHARLDGTLVESWDTLVVVRVITGQTGQAVSAGQTGGSRQRFW